MGGLLSKESECIKECKVKCGEKSNNEQKKTGFIDSVKEKIEDAKNKLGGIDKGSQQPSQDPSQQSPQQPSQQPSQQSPQQPIPMSGGRRKSKRNISKKRRLKKLKKLKKAKRSRKNNRK